MIKHFLLLLLVLAQTLYAAAGLEAAEIPPKPQAGSNIYVQDYADVISPASEKIIYSIGRELDSKTTAQLAVLTVPTLDGEPIESYALKVLRGWGIGSRDKNMLPRRTGKAALKSVTGWKAHCPTGLPDACRTIPCCPTLNRGSTIKALLTAMPQRQRQLPKNTMLSWRE